MSSLSIGTAKVWMRAYVQVLGKSREYLTELDLAIGGADHDINMARGMNTAMEPMNLDQPDLATLFKEVGLALVFRVSDTAGPLYGTPFMRATKGTGDAGSLDATGSSRALHAGLQGVLNRGKAELQDRTMVDAITPTLETFGAVAAAGLTVAATAVGKVARAGTKATMPLLACRGCASHLDGRLVGYQDPGTTSSVYLLEALAKVVS